jgi:hypothetical protein
MFLVAAVSLCLAASPAPAGAECLEVDQECQNATVILEDEVTSSEIVFDNNVELEDGEASADSCAEEE